MTASQTADGLAALTCRFPARVLFLKAHVDPTIPFEPCQAVKEWYGTLAARTVSVLFASQYTGNPASRFGHTFLHFAKGTPYGQRRLAAADPIVSYAAKTGEVSALSYAWNGIFGGFKGTYSVSTLAEIRDEYANMEDRNLWDYELNFTVDEVDRLIYHLYELRNSWSWYWFTMENCSFQLAAALEAARPNLDVLGRFRFYFLPLDSCSELRTQSRRRELNVTRTSSCCDRRQA